MYTVKMKPQVGEIWQHYKTKGEYEVIALGKLKTKDASLDMEDCVVYRVLLDGSVWVRPLTDFVEILTHKEGVNVFRFHKIR